MAIESEVAQLRELDPEELVTRLGSQEELFNLRFQSATGQLKATVGSAVRRNIARIYTIMRERELGIITDAEGVA